MAFNFNGTSAYIALADVTTVDIPNGDWAYSVWFRRSSTGTDDNIYLGTGATAFFFLYLTSGNALEVAMGDDSGSFIGLGSSPTVVNDTNWHHVVIMRSGSTKSMYLDGSSVDTDTGTFGACTFTSTTKFGEKGTGTAWFVGDIAEAAMWSRALTSDEITALYRGYAPSFYKASMRWYVPMVREYVELKENITVTNTSTTVSDHPRIIYPSGNLYIPRGAVRTLTLTGLASTSAIGTQSVLLNINANGVASVSAIGTASILLNLTLSGLASTTAIGSQVVANTQILTLTGLSSTSALGSPSLGLNIDLSGILNSQAFGSSVLVLNVTANGISSTSALGSPSVGLNIDLTGLGSTSGLGSPTLSYAQTISLLGIPSESVIGTHTISGIQVIVTTGLDSTTLFGTSAVYMRNFEIVTPTTGDFVRVDV